MEAAGISYADLLICQGLHPERRRAPFVPGWDVVEHQRPSLLRALGW
jgi:NADPH:quinone reductase-like Zn-dependent oxidoreductase